MKRFTCLQTVAMVFAMANMICPMAFAIENGRQQGKQTTRQVMERVVGVEKADTLFAQMQNMDMGDVWFQNNTASDVMILDRPEGTFVFNNMARADDGSISGFVSVYDSSGALAYEVDIARLAVVDQNRIDVDISAYAVENVAASESVTWSGSFVGFPGQANGVGMAMLAKNGEATQPMLFNYGNVDLASQSHSPLLTQVIGTDTGGIATENQAEAGSCEDQTVAVTLGGLFALCVLAVVVVVAAVSCVIYCTPRVCC